MTTKYNTGQRVLIPAEIVSASSENGVIMYEVNANSWDKIREEDIILDDRASVFMGMCELREGLIGSIR